MELRTVEVRWFVAGPCPESVSTWFHAGRLVSEPEQRTDYYLALPERDDLGVKQRGGTMLDLKLRTGSRDDVSLSDGFDGRVEAWTKWSFSLSTGEASPRDGAWIAVEKVRWSRLYEVAGGGADAVPVSSITRNGCAAELVEVRVGSHQSWGFGFEAFGEDLEPGTVLEAATGGVLRDTPLGRGEFEASNSHSYPSWLQVWPTVDR